MSLRNFRSIAPISSIERPAKRLEESSPRPRVSSTIFYNFKRIYCRAKAPRIRIILRDPYRDYNIELQLNPVVLKRSFQAFLIKWYYNGQIFVDISTEWSYGADFRGVFEPWVKLWMEIKNQIQALIYAYINFLTQIAIVQVYAYARNSFFFNIELSVFNGMCELKRNGESEQWIWQFEQYFLS